MKNTVSYRMSFGCLNFIWSYSLTLVPTGYSVQKSETTRQRKMTTRTNPPSRGLFFFYFPHTFASHSKIPHHIFYCPFDVKFWPSSFHENCPSWRFVIGTKKSRRMRNTRRRFSEIFGLTRFVRAVFGIFEKRASNYFLNEALIDAVTASRYSQGSC